MGSVVNRVLYLSCCAVAGCNLGGSVDLRDGGAEGDGGAEARVADDGATDVATLFDGGSGPGPVTQLVTGVEVLTDRPCDFDGDGVGDNAFADLGEPYAAVTAQAASSLLQTWGLTDAERWLFHLPWVEDRASLDDPQVVLIAFESMADERCSEQAGDDDGGLADLPACTVDVRSLDGCGEPLSSATDARLDSGTLQASGDRLHILLPLHGVSIGAQFAPGGASSEVTLCGYVLATELGDDRTVLLGREATTLEALVAGGAVMGLPTIRGVQPDVDVDGDGVERLIVDELGQIEQCLDGDGTVIAGRDCWQDPRVADGFAVSIAATTVAARLAEREEGWDDRGCSRFMVSTARCETAICTSFMLERACSEGRGRLADVAACAAEQCREPCRPGASGCLSCLESECPDEVEACDAAPPCCETLPEPSVWDPP